MDCLAYFAYPGSLRGTWPPKAGLDVHEDLCCLRTSYTPIQMTLGVVLMVPGHVQQGTH